ncbi:MAG: histidine kinase [Ginsengibacter sp.]
MNTKTLINLNFDHWQAFLLSFIPALITLGLILYVYYKLPFYKMNRINLLFLFSLFAYQVNDSMHRISGSEETARSWDRLLAILWTIIAPTGLHWALFLTGKKKLANNFRFIVPLYFSLLFFTIPLVAGMYSQPFLYSPFWGWMRTYKNANTFLIVTLAWWCLIFTSMLYLFARFAYKSRNSPDLKFVSFMNFIGYSIPVIGGISTQLVFPLLFNIEPIPIGSTLMVTTVIVVIGLNSYKVFNLSETLDTEYITEILQDIIFVVTPRRTITYINSYGANSTKTTHKERKMVQDIFSNSPRTYDSFQKKVLIPSFKKKSINTCHFSMEDPAGKDIHWDITTYPLLNRNHLDGLLVVCRDITDRFIVAETRLAALRSQMNPHFIFNSLNSVQHYIHSYQREAAESFLSTFSSLMRRILDNSTKPFVSLSDELNTIELYLRLEKARFGDRLNYEINVDANLDKEDTLIPPMLIQPYIENAIIHGLAPKEQGGKVNIKIERINESILCVVEDDGAGRQKAGESNSRRIIKSKSYGMSITQARLEILNQHLDVPVSVKIIDLYNIQNEPCGTRVEIYIPLNEEF